MKNFQHKDDSIIREAVGVFDDIQKLEDAVAELESTAFSREMISVLGSENDMEKHFGQAEVPPQMVEDDPDVPRGSPVRTEEKRIGTSAFVGGGMYAGAISALLAAGAAVSVPAVLVAAAIGGGSAGLLSRILGHRLGEHIEKQIKAGGLVLWVRVDDAENEALARQIMESHGAKDIHVHETK